MELPVSPLNTQLIKPHREGLKTPHHNSLKTHCKRGHVFSKENTRIEIKVGTNKSRRVCKTCNKDIKNKWILRKAEILKSQSIEG